MEFAYLQLQRRSRPDGRLMSMDSTSRRSRLAIQLKAGRFTSSLVLGMVALPQSTGTSTPQQRTKRASRQIVTQHRASSSMRGHALESRP